MIFFIIIKRNSSRIKKKNFEKIGNLQMWEHLIHTLKGQKVFIDTDSEFIIKKTKKKTTPKLLFELILMLFFCKIRLMKVVSSCPLF